MPQEGTGPTSSDDIQKLRAELDAIKRRLSEIGDPEFPELVQQVNFPVTSPQLAPALPADDTRSALASILGWRVNPLDPEGFIAALTQAFPLVEFEGNQVAKWMPRSYSVQALQAGMGSITGAQASIYSRAKVALDQILPLLDGLKPLTPTADVEDMEAIRAIIRPELIELVDELGAEGGPRVQRVDTLFHLLLKYDYTTGTGRTLSDPETVTGQLGELRDRFGLKGVNVNTIEEEQNLTNFYILVNHIDSLLLSWDGQRHFFDRFGADVFFGTQMVLLSRALAVVAESVQELYFALDSVFIGSAERQVLMLGSDPPLSVAELLSWVDDATREGIALMQKGGKDGVVLAFAPLISRIYKLMKSALGVSGKNYRRLPDGFRTARVRGAISALLSQLKVVRGLAVQIRHRPVSLDEIFPVSARIGDTEVRITINGDNLESGSHVKLTKSEPPVDSVIEQDSSTVTTLLEEMPVQRGRRSRSMRAATVAGSGVQAGGRPADIEAKRMIFINEREIRAVFDLTLPTGTDAAAFAGFWNLIITDPDDDFQYWMMRAFEVKSDAGPPTSIVTVDVECPPDANAGDRIDFTARVKVDGAPASATLGYDWMVDGGRIDGNRDMPSITVDTSGVTAPSTITATVRVTDLPGGAEKTAQGTTQIRQSPSTVKVEVQCPDEVDEGNAIIFTATVDGADPAGLNYAWTVSAGSIPVNTNSSSIQVDTTGISGPSSITATVTVSGLPGGAEKTAVGTTRISPSTPTATVEVECLETTGAGGVIPFTARVNISDTSRLTYAWEVSDGDIIGDDTLPSITVDTHGVAARSITATVTVSGLPGGGDIIGSGTTQISPSRPLDVSCPEEVNEGEPITFEVIVDGADPAQLHYEWVIAAGRISEDNGSSIIVDTIGISGPSSITATVTVTGLPDGVPQTVDGTTQIRAPQESGLIAAATKFDEYHRISLHEEHQRLDKFVEALKNQPGAQGRVIVHPGRKDVAGEAEAEAHAFAIKAYLAVRHALDPKQARVVTTTGDPQKEWTVELWITPPTETSPKEKRKR